MTACVNKHTKRVAAVVTASLVGALSLGVAAPAFAAGGIDTLAVPSDAWGGVDFTWSAEADSFGNFTVQVGDEFMLDSAVDAFGDPVSMSNLTVAYVYADTEINWPAIQPGNSRKVLSTTPEEAGTYNAVVINGRVDLSKVTTLGELKAAMGSLKSHEQLFTVAAKSLTGAFAYEGDDVADTTFKYTGAKKDVNFADADGNEIDLGTGEGTDGVTATFSKDPIDAGTYIATLTGDGTSYSGTTTVEFKIDKIDFENDVFTVDTTELNKATFTPGSAGGNSMMTSIGLIKVNGEALDPSADVNAYVVSAINEDGVAWANPINYSSSVAAKLVLKLSSSDTDNFTGSDATASMLVVKDLVDDYYYDEEGIPTTGLKFETAKGEALDPSLFTAVYGTKNVPVDVTITKDGEEVSEYTEPGKYKVHIEVAVPNDLSYGGSKDVEVTVISRRYSEQPKVYAAIDGKDADGAEVEYDGKAVEPVVVAKAGGATLAEGTDYTVTYKDAGGNAVEEIVEPGKYSALVDFGDAQIVKNGTTTSVDDVEFSFEVTKAQLRSAKADKDVYAYTGEAVTPVFTAYNEGDLEGLSVEIDPAVTGVSYYECDLNENGDPYTDGNGTYYTVRGPLKASDLTDEGYYVAVVTAPADDPHFTGETQSEPFQISEYAAFSDVDASAWYADAVYNAADLGYMTGISGTDLFMPMADITRAELAKVFGNMAGKAFSPIYTPTKFDDVDPLAWYAGAVVWADEAGIVTGYDDTTFGPSDKATREQVAVMLYRYAAGQGKDVTVDDVEGTLAAYKDGDQVSNWARTAMAWAVENGVFGQGTDELWAKQNIQRAAVATIAVRFQPEALPEA